MDVVALAQYGISYSVATLGTATTTDHLHQLFRTVSRVIFCFDGDRAGRDAATKAMDVALPQVRDGREILFMFLPEGEDPDSLVRKEGQNRFEQRVRQATPLSTFFFDQLLQQGGLQSMDGRAKLVAQARPKLSRLPAGMFREMMFKRLSEMVEIEEEKLTDHLLETPPPRPPSRTSQAGQRPANSGPSPVRNALHALLHHPQLFMHIPSTSDIQKIDNPGIPLLIEVIETLQQNPDLTTAALLERWRDRADEQLLHKVAQWTPPTPEKGIEQEFIDTIEKLQHQGQEQEYARLVKKAESQPLDKKEKQRFTELLTLFK